MNEEASVFFVLFLTPKTTRNKTFVVLYRYLSFLTINLSFQRVNLSFYVVLSVILDNKFIICYFFHIRIQHKTINISFCIIFASIKLPQHKILKTNDCLNKTIIFLLSCCVVSYRWSLNPRPLEDNPLLFN